MVQGFGSLKANTDENQQMCMHTSPRYLWLPYTRSLLHKSKRQKDWIWNQVFPLFSWRQGATLEVHAFPLRTHSSEPKISRTARNHSVSTILGSRRCFVFKRNRHATLHLTQRTLSRGTLIVRFPTRIRILERKNWLRISNQTLNIFFAILSSKHATLGPRWMRKKKKRRNWNTYSRFQVRQYMCVTLWGWHSLPRYAATFYGYSVLAADKGYNSCNTPGNSVKNRIFDDIEYEITNRIRI